MPSERKSFVVQYRAGRRPRRMSLGPSTVLTCDQARTRAITIIAAVRNGEDPSADRAAKRNAVTVAACRGSVGNNRAYVIVATWKTGAVMDVQSGFRFLTKDFAPSCFRNASGQCGNANCAPWGALQVTDNTNYSGCGGKI